MRPLALAFAALSCAGTAHAGFTTYTSEAAYLAALGPTPVVTQDFEGPAPDTLITSPPANAGVFDGVTYTVSGPTLGGSQARGRIDTLYFGFGVKSLAAFREEPAFGEGPNESVFYAGEFVTLTFPAPVTAVGIYFNADPLTTETGDFFLDVPGVGIAQNGTDPVPGTGQNPADASLYFVGLVSDTPFTTVRVGAVSVEGTAREPFGFNLDNLSYAPATPVAAVPAPPSALLALSALLAAGAAGNWRKWRGTPAVA